MLDQVSHLGDLPLQIALARLERAGLVRPLILRVVAEARPSTVAVAALAPPAAAFAASRGSGSLALTAAALAAILLFLTPVSGVASVTAPVSTSNHLVFLSRTTRYRARNLAIPSRVRSRAVAHWSRSFAPAGVIS